MIEGKCFQCQTRLTFETRVFRQDDCPNCRADVHACKNCRFYDPQAYNECKEPSAERCTEKERANFCDYFELGSGQESGRGSADLKAAAEALFKK